ncbi:hypothetical protein [Chroococcidiopsis sp. CCALA 051]|uniref:hypothetical protein n=1 Tax=Chroococcidiopsis sp. CCALA 051 TaxID=869949 RepID=UPI001304D589|nr:hypothetical protein [Chroococcidiopsis sp. CCALA 051]
MPFAVCHDAARIRLGLRCGNRPSNLSRIRKIFLIQPSITANGRSNIAIACDGNTGATS